MTFNKYMERNIQLNECSHIETLATSAGKIAHHNFKWQYITLVLMNITMYCGVNTFLEIYNKTAVLATNKLIPDFNHFTKQFVLFGNNLFSIIELVEWMELHEYDNTGRFLVICQSVLKEDCHEIEAINMFWQHNIVDVVFINNILPKPVAMGYTYEYGNECRNGPATEIQDWDKCMKLDEEYCKSIYPLKLQNMYGCPVVVSTFIQKPYMNFSLGNPTGADGDLLNFIIEALNASLIIRTPWRGDGWGNLNENSTWVGSLGDLYNDLANFSMTSASITQTRYSDFQISNFYYMVNLVWVTHPRETELSSNKLLRPFKVDARIAIVVSFGVVSCFVLFLKTKYCTFLLNMLRLRYNVGNILFNSWEICMGQPTSTFPSKMVFSYVVLIWIWYCFLMRTFYQVHLINSLKTDVYLNDFTSIEAAIAAEYPFGGGSALKDYYIDQSIVYNNWQHKDSSEYEPLMLNLTSGMKFVLAMNLATTKDFLKEPGRKLHILPQAILNCPTAIFFKKYSPLAKPINRILERLVEFGWPNMFFKKSTTKNKIEKVEDEDKPITLNNFAGCYLILLSGWILSILLFVIEICHIKRQTRNIIQYRN